MKGFLICIANSIHKNRFNTVYFLKIIIQKFVFCYFLPHTHSFVVLVVMLMYFIKILKTVYFLTVVALIITLPRILLIRIPMFMRCWKMIVCDLT